MPWAKKHGDIPIQIQIYTKKKGAPSPAKNQFHKLNNTAINHHKFSELRRYRIAKNKLQAFAPENIAPPSDTLKISQVNLIIDNTPTTAKGSVAVEIFAPSLSSKVPTKIFVKLEQAGRVNMGQLVLAENVISALLSEFGKLKFYLNGPLSPLYSDFFYQMTFSLVTAFRLSLALSTDDEA